jgi:hypothetical protein
MVLNIVNERSAGVTAPNVVTSISFVYLRKFAWKNSQSFFSRGTRFGAFVAWRNLAAMVAGAAFSVWLGRYDRGHHFQSAPFSQQLAAFSSPDLVLQQAGDSATSVGGHLRTKGKCFPDEKRLV